MLRRYRHIIWDWNGTLLNDLALSIEVMNAILRREGLPPLDCARYHAVFDFPVRDYYARLGLDPTDAGFRRFSHEFIAGYDARRFEAALHEGCDALLAGINARGVTQSILSAYRHETLCEVVAHFGVAPRFVRLTGLDNIYAHSKTELGRRCLAELGVPPGETLLIGDTLHDHEVAQALGTDCLLVAHGHHPAARLRRTGARVLENLAAVADVLGVTPAPRQTAASETAGRGNPAG